MEHSDKERMEPIVDVAHEPEEHPPLSGYQRTQQSSSLKKWGLGLILFVMLGSLAFGVWMIFPTSRLQNKNQTSPQVSKIETGEIPEAKQEIITLKNEIQPLREGQKAIQEQIKELQEQVKSIKDKITALEKKNEPKVEKKAPAKAVWVRVKRNETLDSIAKKFNVSPDDIRKWNKIPSKKSLKPGQKLILHL